MTKTREQIKAMSKYEHAMLIVNSPAGTYSKETVQTAITILSLALTSDAYREAIKRMPS